MPVTTEHFRPVRWFGVTSSNIL